MPGNAPPARTAFASAGQSTACANRNAMNPTVASGTSASPPQ